jgi:lipopolysaccharide assembly outer membrane protein LptD (OstA)
MKRVLPALAAAALLLAASPSPSPAPSPSAVTSPSKSPGPDSFAVGVWTVRASLLDVNFKTGDFSTPNQVTMNRGGGDITADRASGNYKTKDATLYGHVVVHDFQGSFGGIANTQPTQSHGPSTLTADQVNINGAGKTYTATGNVHYVQADTTVDADKGVLDDLTHNLDLTGNVKMVQGDRNMLAGHVLYNTITGLAHADDNVTMQFPSEITPHLATPRPIHIRNPIHGKATPQPQAT